MFRIYHRRTEPQNRNETPPETNFTGFTFDVFADAMHYIQSTNNACNYIIWRDGGYLLKIRPRCGDLNIDFDKIIALQPAHLPADN
jgi:hypothetical protein